MVIMFMNDSSPPPPPTATPHRPAAAAGGPVSCGGAGGQQRRRGGEAGGVVGEEQHVSPLLGFCQACLLAIMFVNESSPLGLSCACGHGALSFGPGGGAGDGGRRRRHGGEAEGLVCGGECVLQEQHVSPLLGFCQCHMTCMPA